MKMDADNHQGFASQCVEFCMNEYVNIFVLGSAEGGR